MKHIHSIKVRGFHCDAYGHVNNARYLEFLEEARWSYMEEGPGLAYWAKRGLGFIVASLTINYRRPAEPGAILEIHSHLKHFGGKTGIIHQEVINAETRKTVADADVTFVILNLETKKIQAMEGEIKTAFDLVEAALKKKEAGRES